VRIISRKGAESCGRPGRGVTRTYVTRGQCHAWEFVASPFPYRVSIKNPFRSLFSGDVSRYRRAIFLPRPDEHLARLDLPSSRWLRGGIWKISSTTREQNRDRNPDLSLRFVALAASGNANLWGSWYSSTRGGTLPIMSMAVDFCDFFKKIVVSYDSCPFTFLSWDKPAGDSRNQSVSLTLDIIRRVIYDFWDEGSPV